MPDRVLLFPILMFLAAGRSGITCREFATNGKALAEAQLLAQARFDLDTITACSNAFRVSAELARDMGGELVFPEDKPRYLRRPLITSTTNLDNLSRPDPTDKKSRMNDRLLGISETAKAVSGRVTVLGWIDMPFEEACSIQATPDQCRDLAYECISVAQGTKYMLSAGCEVPAETPDEVIRAFCSAPKTYQEEGLK